MDTPVMGVVEPLPTPPPPTEGTVALRPVFLSGQSDFVATRAATNALMQGKTMEEAEAIGLEAARRADEQDESTEQERRQQYERDLEHAYWEAICNIGRGVSDLPLKLKQEAATVLRIQFVDFETWKERNGYGAQS